MDMPDLYTEKKVSPVGQVNKADIQSWITNLEIFLAPLALLYVLQLYASAQKGVIDLKDLVPTPATVGAIQLYVINAVLGLLKKFGDGKK